MSALAILGIWAGLAAVWTSGFVLGSRFVCRQVRKGLAEAHAALDRLSAPRAGLQPDGPWRTTATPAVADAWAGAWLITSAGLSAEQQAAIKAAVQRAMCESCMDHVATHLVTWPSQDGHEVEPFAVCSLCLQLVGGDHVQVTEL